MTDMRSVPDFTPKSVVEIRPELLNPSALLEGAPIDSQMPPEMAASLISVLLASAEQIGATKLNQFGAQTANDLTIMQLAMAFQDSDSGLAGDVFEWALLLAINSGDRDVRNLLTDALQLCDIKVDEPRAVLVAAEPNRLVAFSPSLPARAALATGARGRPPRIQNILSNATTANWKADLVVGAPDERWVTVSVKSNPRDLPRSLREAANTRYAPRIGITMARKGSVRRHIETGTLLVDVPVHGPSLAIAKLVLTEVVTAFSRHLKVPSSPMSDGITPIGRQLNKWQDRTVGEVVRKLLNVTQGHVPPQKEPTA